MCIHWIDYEHSFEWMTFSSAQSDNFIEMTSKFIHSIFKARFLVALFKIRTQECQRFMRSTLLIECVSFVSLFQLKFVYQICRENTTLGWYTHHIIFTEKLFFPYTLSKFIQLYGIHWLNISILTCSLLSSLAYLFFFRMEKDTQYDFCRWQKE